MKAEWKFIETAPVCEYILVYCNNEVQIAMQARGILGAERKWLNINRFRIYPTHWMKLSEIDGPELN